MNEIEISRQLEVLMDAMCFDAIDIARQYCDTTQDEPSCEHYHGIRFLLHNLGARTTLPCQIEVFYTDLVNSLGKTNPKQERLRILISGTADFVVPALVSFAVKEAGLIADVIIVDRCETPLQLSRKAAQKFGFDWQYLKSDIIDLKFDEPFDLIITDRLLGHIPPEARPSILNKWATLLTAKGQFLTMVSLRPMKKASNRDANSLLKKLQEIEGKYRLDDRYPINELTQMIVSYANTRNNYRIPNQTYVEKLIEPSQLSIKSIKPVETFPHSTRDDNPLALIKLLAQSHHIPSTAN